MPHISIKMYPGRSKELKENLSKKMLEFISKEMDLDEKFFSISIEDVEQENWKAEVKDKIKEEDLYIKAEA